MKRFDDWPGLLDEFVRSRRAAKFVWGTNDCVLFACDAVLAMTGEDLAHGFRDTYETALQARRSMRKNFEVDTIGELSDVVARRCGIGEVPPSFAQRGDVVLLQRELGESLGVVNLAGDEIWAPAPECLVELPFADARRAWRI